MIAPAHASVLALEALLEFPREMDVRGSPPQNDASELATVRALMRATESPALERLLALLETPDEQARAHALVSVVRESLAASGAVVVPTAPALAACRAVLAASTTDVAAIWARPHGACAAPRPSTPLADAYLVRELAASNAPKRELFNAACVAGRFAFAHYTCGADAPSLAAVAATAAAGEHALLARMLEAAAEVRLNGEPVYHTACFAAAYLGAAAAASAETLALVLERRRGDALPLLELFLAVLCRDESLADTIRERHAEGTRALRLATRAAAVSGWLEYLDKLLPSIADPHERNTLVRAAIASEQLHVLERMLELVPPVPVSEDHLALAMTYGRSRALAALLKRRQVTTAAGERRCLLASAIIGGSLECLEMLLHVFDCRFVHDCSYLAWLDEALRVYLPLAGGLQRFDQVRALLAYERRVREHVQFTAESPRARALVTAVWCGEDATALALLAQLGGRIARVPGAASELLLRGAVCSCSIAVVRALLASTCVETGAPPVVDCITLEHAADTAEPACLALLLEHSDATAVTRGQYRRLLAAVRLLAAMRRAPEHEHERIVRAYGCTRGFY